MCKWVGQERELGGLQVKSRTEGGNNMNGVILRESDGSNEARPGQETEEQHFMADLS